MNRLIVTVVLALMATPLLAKTEPRPSVFFQPGNPFETAVQMQLGTFADITNVQEHATYDVLVAPVMVVDQKQASATVRLVDRAGTTVWTYTTEHTLKYQAGAFGLVGLAVSATIEAKGGHDPLSGYADAKESYDSMAEDVIKHMKKDFFKRK
jgi:hypothetical protein